MFDCLLDLCSCIFMRFFLVTWHLGQDDNITLILYTNVNIFKVTLTKRAGNMCHNLYVS